MKYLSLLAVLALFTFAACMDDDDSGQLDNVPFTIDFRSAYNGADLAIQSTTYDYPTGAKLKATLFQYYISDLSLVNADGSAIVLSDIELVRYNSAIDDAVVSYTYDAPTGDYVGIRFGLGVKPDLNAMDPSVFSANDPLNETEFWNANARYVFAKWEGNADLNDNGTFDSGMTYHLGNDDLYTTLTFNGNFTIDGTDDPAITISSDYLKSLSDGTTAGTFDIAAVDRIHGGNQAISNELWNRFANQFTMEIR